MAQGIDFIIVRELIGGVYFGQHQTHTLENGEKQAVDTMPYAEHEIERIGRIGFETARKRRKKLCCVDKANVLDTSRLWRTVMHRLQAEYPDVEYSEMFVDNCAMQIVKNPAQFDVIVTENMFGDILSDEASMITGSIGMIPSSSLGDGTQGLQAHRLCPGHCEAGHRASPCLHPVRRHDAAVLLWHGRGSRCH